MTTDPGLPQVLNTAAARADEVGRHLTSVVTTLTVTSIRAQLSWGGPSATAWSRGCAAAAKALAADARAAYSLAATLRGAATSANTRIQQERAAAAAAEARRKAEAAAAAAKTKK